MHAHYRTRQYVCLRREEAHGFREGRHESIVTDLHSVQVTHARTIYHASRKHRSFSVPDAGIMETLDWAPAGYDAALRLPLGLVGCVEATTFSEARSPDRGAIYQRSVVQAFAC